MLCLSNCKIQVQHRPWKIHAILVGANIFHASLVWECQNDEVNQECLLEFLLVQAYHQQYPMWPGKKVDNKVSRGLLGLV